MVGGTCGTSIPKIVLENTAADMICIDEGEITSVELANTLERGESLNKVAGIWFKDKKNRYPKAERYYQGAITLPLYPRMTDDDVKYVIKVLKKSL